MKSNERTLMKPSEAVAMGLLLEEKERPLLREARRRGALMTKAKRLGGAPGNFPRARARGDLRDRIGLQIGMTGSAFDRAKKIVRSAQADPQKFGDLVAKLDQGISVYRVFEEYKYLIKPNGEIRKPRHAVLRKLRHSLPNREVQRAVYALSGICMCLDRISVKDLDPQKAAEWARELQQSALTISKFSKELIYVKSNR